MHKQLTPEQSDLAVNFYDIASDHPKLNFAEVSKKFLVQRDSKRTIGSSVNVGSTLVSLGIMLDRESDD